MQNYLPSKLRDISNRRMEKEKTVRILAGFYLLFSILGQNCKGRQVLMFTL
jgi:hypothetical protein